MKTKCVLPEPAHGDLGLVQAFVNTTSPATGDDVLTNAEALGDWLARRRLLPRIIRLTPEDHRRAIELRRGLRSLIAANSGAEVDTGAIELLDRTLSTSALRVRFAPDGTGHLEPMADGFDGVCALVAQAVVQTQGEGRWQRLKICVRPDCGLAFYDASNNRSGRWCSKRCSDLIHARASRRRHPGKSGSRLHIYRQR